VHARNGREVVDMLFAGSYDLVLMDCQMPVLDGYAATGEIRDREAAGDQLQVPIVAMTANALQGDREKCLAAGMNDYIAKPINPDLLDQALARWLPVADPSPTPAAEAELDRSRLDVLRSLFSEEEMQSMLRDLAATITDELDCLERAVSEGDHGAARGEAHRLKNSASMIGATVLAQAAVELESQLGESEPRPRIAAAVRELREHWAATRASLDLELAQTAG